MLSMLFFFVSCVLHSALLIKTDGFVAGTLIKTTPTTYVPIEQLAINDTLVASQNNQHCPIVRATKKTADHYVKINAIQKNNTFVIEPTINGRAVTQSPEGNKPSISITPISEPLPENTGYAIGDPISSDSHGCGGTDAHTQEHSAHSPLTTDLYDSVHNNEGSDSYHN